MRGGRVHQRLGDDRRGVRGPRPGGLRARTQDLRGRRRRGPHHARGRPGQGRPGLLRLQPVRRGGARADPGLEAGECFGRAEVLAPGLHRRERTTFRCDGGRAPKANAGTRRPAPRPVGPARILGSAPDPWGKPPEAGSVGDRRPEDQADAPPWAVLVWRDARDRTCVEPGQVIDDRTPGRSDQLPGVKPVGRLRRARLLGSLRYDARSGVTIQLYGVGRFAPYPRAVGGSCGRTGSLLLGFESRYPRPDQAFATTAMSGIAPPDVVRIDGLIDGRLAATARPTREGAFIATFRGVPAAAALSARVTYRDGRATTLR